MRIVNNIDRLVKFSTLLVGECFMYDKCLFIKMQPIKKAGGTTHNAYCFVDNAIAAIPEDWHVMPVDAEIIIKGKGVV